MDSPAELATQAACYGLPYGIFGIFCWSFTFFSVCLTHANCPIFAPWRWGKDYKAPRVLFTIVSSLLVLGPAIYTCLSCGSDWILLLVTLGQLTPWGFKIMNDGYQSLRFNNTNGLWRTYKKGGLVVTILFSLIGWIGMTALSVSLMKTDKAVSVWIWSLYLIALIAMILSCCAACADSPSFQLLMVYIFATLHIIGSHVIFALITNHWSGIAPTGAGLLSSIIFFVGKRLLFLDTNCK